MFVLFFVNTGIKPRLIWNISTSISEYVSISNSSPVVSLEHTSAGRDFGLWRYSVSDLLFHGLLIEDLLLAKYRLGRIPKSTPNRDNTF